MPFIGMRNPGARCYINAMVQQLWGVEAFRECINNATPAVDDSDASAGENPLRVLCAVKRMHRKPSSVCLVRYVMLVVLLVLHQSPSATAKMYSAKARCVLKATGLLRPLKQC